MYNNGIMFKLKHVKLIGLEKKRYGNVEDIKKLLDTDSRVSGGDLDFDLHSALPKIPLNPPGYKYLGPNNPLEDQVDLQTGLPKPGNEPSNDLDAIALKHDLLYYYAELEGKDKADILKRKHLADEIFIKEAEASPGKTWREKFWNWISRNIINAKMKLGMGITEEDILSKINKAGNKKSILKYLRENVHIV
jgi:hypothetical protein